MNHELGQFIATIEKNRFRFYRVALSLLVGLPVLAMTLWVVTVQPHPRGKLFRSQMALVFGSEILLKEITKPLTMTVFLPEGSAEGQGAEVVLQTYVSNHPLVSYRFVDPERELLKAQQGGVSRSRECAAGLRWAAAAGRAAHSPGYQHSAARAPEGRSPTSVSQGTLRIGEKPTKDQGERQDASEWKGTRCGEVV